MKKEKIVGEIETPSGIEGEAANVHSASPFPVIPDGMGGNAS